jgi:hypothetical protein
MVKRGFTPQTLQDPVPRVKIRKRKESEDSIFSDNIFDTLSDNVEDSESVNLPNN